MENLIKEIPERMYATCPICSTILIQAKTLIDGTIKCEKCHQRIKVSIISGKVTTVPLKLEN